MFDGFTRTEIETSGARYTTPRDMTRRDFEVSIRTLELSNCTGPSRGLFSF